jgi:hypothetical protein
LRPAKRTTLTAEIVIFFFVGRDSVELVKMGSVSGPARERSVSFTNHILDRQPQAVRHRVARSCSLSSPGTSIACGWVVVHTIGGEEFVRQRQMAFVPEILEQATSDFLGFLLT